MGWLTDWRRSACFQASHGRCALESGDPWPDVPSCKRELKSLVLLFLAEKEFSGAHGMQVTDAMRVSIAAQACLPILEMGLDWYSGWTGIVIYRAISACGAPSSTSTA